MRSVEINTGLNIPFFESVMRTVLGFEEPRLIDHEPKRKPRRARRGQARQLFFGAEGSPSLWRRSSDRKVGVLHIV